MPGSLQRCASIVSILIALASSMVVAQGEDTTRIGIHQEESEIHRWDVLKTHPKVPDLQNGADLVRAGDIQGAMRAFQKAAPLRRSYAYFNIGVVYFETGNIERARRYLQLSYNARRDSVCLEYLTNARRILKERSRSR